jgi:hypothetical protein
MALHIYQISDYDHAAERRLFVTIARQLAESAAAKGEEWHLVGNYGIEQGQCSALIIVPQGVGLLFFKQGEGQLSLDDKGRWLANGSLVTGGMAFHNPQVQAFINVRRMGTALAKYLPTPRPTVGVTVVFDHPIVEPSGFLDEQARKWLSVCGADHLDDVLPRSNGNDLTATQVARLVECLGLQPYELMADGMKRKRPSAGQAFEPESATEFFEQLLQANDEPDMRKRYSDFNRIFTHFIDQHTSTTGIQLVGRFAKTDYLLKEHAASPSLRQAVNDTRVRLYDACNGRLEGQALTENAPFDFKALALLIALVYETAVPAEVARCIPENRPQRTSKLPEADCWRMKVEKWDDDYVWGVVDNASASEVKVCYSQGNKFYPFDWSYLKNYLSYGCQLNLIRPRLYEGVVFPELIIVEPDMLIDISAIAACFEQYGHSAINYLLGKIRPNESTPAILLGNFAGQLLDEEVHGEASSRSYADSVKTFFGNNALNLLTAGVGPDFHDEAKRQKANIHRNIGQVLPQAVKEYRAEEVMLEPSFFSEMLGLQGRMDFLQLDFKVLIEQKSGKCAWPQSNPDTPKEQEKHYVQMLLYMALIRYNYREQYEKNEHGLHAFLLYSKYANSLLGLGFAPRLLFEAIKVRNGIAWGELYYSHGGFRILESLTADKLNQNQVNNSLWVNYQRPQLETLLAPIRQASPLERAYYFRFLTFIEKEHLLSKVGNQTKEDSGFAAKWHDTLEEKLAAGNIYDRLQLIDPNADSQGRVDEVTLLFQEDADNDMSNFRVGDIVILYPYRPPREPDARRTMVFRCSIKELSANTVTLMLRAPQSDAHVFLRYQGCLWAIEHDFFESSFSSLYRGMHAFLSAPKERRDLLLLQREPQWNPNARLLNDDPEAYGDFKDLALKVKQANDFFLIIGPPGTGKTSFGLLYTLREALLEPNASVLLLSFTNRAVDEICSKLDEDGIDFIRIGNALSCAERYHDHLIGNVVETCSNLDEVGKRLKSCRVYVGTTTAMNANIALFKLKQFSLAIIDEASQILEPHLLGLLSAHVSGKASIEKFVLIGDHKQLPAVVQQTVDDSRVMEPELRAIMLTDCRLSLFERLLRRYHANPHVTYMLTRQGRMHPEIARFPNLAFYQGRLKEVPLPHQTGNLPDPQPDDDGLTQLLSSRRMAFIAAPLPEESPSDKVNQVEADLIAALVDRIYRLNERHFDPLVTVGVIVPYRNQIATVRNTLQERYHTPYASQITIDTVERYQGSQREYIVYGFTVQKYYQLSFLTNNVFEEEGSIIDRKLNVAMTRARQHLFLVGNPGLLSNNFTFFELIAYARLQGSFVDVPTKDFVAGRFSLDALPAQTQDLEMTLTGFGRSSFQRPQVMWLDDKKQTVEPAQQVALYEKLFLPQHLEEHRLALEALEPRLEASVDKSGENLLWVDMGCGPAVGGLAIGRKWLERWPSMTYLGIDTAPVMLQEGKRLLEKEFGGKLHFELKERLMAATDDSWKPLGTGPHTVVLECSHIFGSISASTSERLARQMVALMERYPNIHFVVLMLFSDLDTGLNSFQVFSQILQPHIANSLEATPLPLSRTAIPATPTFLQIMEGKPTSPDSCGTNAQG